MRELKITIEGEAATGKSSLAKAIRNICEENGIAVDVTGCEDETGGVITEQFAKRLKSLSGKVSVVVETKQLPRRSHPQIGKEENG